MNYKERGGGGGGKLVVVVHLSDQYQVERSYTPRAASSQNQGKPDNTLDILHSVGGENVQR